MRQPLRQVSIPKPCQQQKQQSEHPKIAFRNRSSSASQIQYQQQPNAPFSEAKKRASGRNDTSMELASLILNSEMHCIFDIVEHHPTSSLFAMVGELNSTLLMALSAKKDDWSSNAMTKNQVGALRPCRQSCPHL